MSVRRYLPVVLGALALLPASCGDAAPAKPSVAAKPAAAAVIAPAPVAPLTGRVQGADFQLDGEMTQGSLIRGVAPVGTRSLSFDGALVPVAPDGRFVIGMSADAPPRAELVATTTGGRIARTLTVSPRAWHLEKVPGIPRYPVSSAEFNARRPGELAQINAARHVESDAQGWRQRFIWPAKGRLSGLFGSQREYANGEKGAPHSGTDIAVPTGTPVKAPADGVVTLAAAKPFTLEGNLLMIDHGAGVNTAFLHLSRIDVKPGDHVVQGQVVGAVGMTGRASGPHLHWAMKWRQAKLDPLLVAGAM